MYVKVVDAITNYELCRIESNNAKAAIKCALSEARYYRNEFKHCVTVFDLNTDKEIFSATMFGKNYWHPNNGWWTD